MLGCPVVAAVPSASPVCALGPSVHHAGKSRNKWDQLTSIANSLLASCHLLPVETFCLAVFFLPAHPTVQTQVGPAVHAKLDTLPSGRKDCYDGTCNQSRRSCNILSSAQWHVLGKYFIIFHPTGSNLIKLHKAKFAAERLKGWKHPAWNEGGPSIWRFVQHLLPGMLRCQSSDTNITLLHKMRNFISRQSKASFFTRNRGSCAFFWWVYAGVNLVGCFCQCILRAPSARLVMSWSSSLPPRGCSCCNKCHGAVRTVRWKHSQGKSLTPKAMPWHHMNHDKAIEPNRISMNIN